MGALLQWNGPVPRRELRVYLQLRDCLRLVLAWAGAGKDTRIVGNHIVGLPDQFGSGKARPW